MSCVIALVFCCATSLLSAVELQTGDWPCWRGAQRDNISRERGLLASWGPDGPQLLWKASGLGEGFSSVSVVGDVAYSMGNNGGEEQVLALDLKENGIRR